MVCRIYSLSFTSSTNPRLVYNIIMDFVLASFPWVITWNLDMRRVEKIGLCITMSLVCCNNCG
jgi:hypothetical protein